MDSRERFTDRADDYEKFRPSYPDEVVFAMRSMRAGNVVADIGSGTGISSRLFLDAGFEVFGVEPNAAMRAKAERRPDFHSVDGTSSATGLASASIDVVVAAQAFHWFDPEPTRAEFRRILRPGGLVAILFNDRDASTPFGRAYEQILREFGQDYEKVRHRNVGEERHRTFLGAHQHFRFPNSQNLEFAALLGRVASSSYAPKEGSPAFEPMKARLREVFERFATNGAVELSYVTHLLVARW